MSPAAFDTQLLFGVLALQNAFVSREELLTAANVWLENKSLPLNEIMLQRGFLQDDEYQLLSALVEKHLQRHSHDPQKSLAAVSSLGSVKECLGNLDDEQLNASLAHVAADRADPHQTQVSSIGDWTKEELRFRILRPHARGGLGQVYVAQDEELHREVALKEIQLHRANDPQSRKRFVLEAEITGGLEHPGIVPVYGLGQYRDGRPFYAMRFIRGDAFGEAIDRFHQRDGLSRDEGGWRDLGERMLELRKLLGRFIDVCNAIDYAHSRGVLHRDLKPGNIMLGRHGETLVVDWGLAKTVGRDAERIEADEMALRPQSADSVDATQMGSAVGTPQYMSPEQASGRLDLLGPASDVYSLGATLYCLLTGRPPLPDGSLEEVLRKVGRGEIQRPGSAKHGIPKPLEAVCMKAMALKCEDRYESVRDIAEDIEHWLADEPVNVVPESAIQRVTRWLRHHRSVAQAGAIALLVITILAVVAAAWIDSERRRADRNATAFRQQRDIADTQKTRAEREKLRADANAGLAGQQRDLTLETLEKLVYEVNDKLGDRPGMRQLKEEILNLAIDGLMKVARDVDLDAHETQMIAMQDEMSTDDQRRSVVNQDTRRAATIDLDLAIALRRMGDIFRSTGRLEEAIEQYENSQRIVQRLVHFDPSWQVAQQSLANSLDRIGAIQLRFGEPQKSTKAYEAAYQIREKMVAVDPEDVAGLLALSVSYIDLADASLLVSDYPKAYGHYRRALRIRQSVAGDRPQDVERQRSLAYIHNDLSNLCLRIGLLDLAHEHAQQSLKLRSDLAANDPASPSNQRMLGAGYTALGNVLLSTGRANEARTMFLKRLELAERMLKADPESLRAKRDCKLAFNRIGILCSREGRVAEARGYLQREIELAELVAREAPGDIQWQTLLAAAYSNFAMNEMRAGNVVEFAKWSAKAVATEAIVRAQGKATQWALLPKWVDEPLKVVNPKRDVIRVLSDIDFVNSQPVDVASEMLLFRCAVLVRRGDLQGAVDSVKRMESLARDNAELWFDAVCCYAICFDASIQTAGDADQVDPNARMHQTYVDSALRCLAKAIECGFRNTTRLKTNPDLRSLRDQKEFNRLLAEIAL